MQFLRLICWFTILVYSISADLTTRERIELHKQWLESRAAFKALYETNNNTNNLSYFKKMLKLKSDYKPYSLTNTNNNNNNNNNNYYINKNNNIPNKKYEYKIFNKQNASKNDVLQPDEQIYLKRKNVPTPTPSPRHSMQIINLPSLVSTTTTTTTTTTPITSYTKTTPIKPSTTTQSINAYVTTTGKPYNTLDSSFSPSSTSSTSSQLINSFLTTSPTSLSSTTTSAPLITPFLTSLTTSLPSSSSSLSLPLITPFSTSLPTSSSKQLITTSPKSIKNMFPSVTVTATPTPTTTTLPPPTTTTAAAITLTTQPIHIKPIVISGGKQNITKPWKKPKRRMSIWGNWEKWTTCSRTCGGGVMSQSRNCIYRPVHNQTTNSGNRLSKDCIGLYRRYRICNEQNCSDSDTDFREQQCIYYNTQIFRGKQYEWEAYIKDDAECELNCKPIGMSYFATLNETVIDGTLCTRPTEYLKRNYYGRAICVEGTCKAVHASGIITGAFMNSGAVRCGILICRPVTGLYTKNPLPNGYVHIATIPAGASNISITELKNSMNFLVLKSGNQKYIINGDFSVSLSGIYEASGALFDYRRIDGLINGSHHINRKIDGVTEWITSTGPITEPIHLMVLAQESNPGIKYEYLLPINSVSSSSEEMSNSYEYTSGETEQPITTLSTSDQIGKHTLKSGAPAIVHANMTMPIKRKRKFLWKVVGFSACSKSCGGGIQSPIIRCVREAPTRIFAAKRCSHLIKPILNENLMRCNTQPCPAYWKIDEWNDCNCGKHNEQIFQSRVIKCVQELGTGMVIQVNIGACLEDEPTFRQKCDCPKIKKHKHNHHELNSIKNRINGIGNGGSGGIAGDIDNTGGGGGNGATKPSVSLIGNSSISKRAHTADNKKNGIWLVSEWNQQCSTDCGDGIQYRSIFCDRSAPTIERCDLRFTPDTTRQCTVTNKCNVGDWFIGPWSQCSGDCFNLTKSRSVFCIKDEEIVSESECNIGSEKPDILQSCGLDEVPDCRPRWHYSEWTECTKKCGGGTQRRTVKCFQPNIEEKQMKDSKNCKYVERPQAYRNCNTFNCESTTQSQPIDPRVDLIQNDIEPVCKDEFPNCNLVVEAHLCNYSYYEAHCCETCRKRS